MEHRALERAGVLHAHHRQRKQVLVDARRRKGVGRSRSRAGPRPTVSPALRAVDAEPRREGLRVGEDVVADPREREVGNDLLVGAEIVELVAVDGGDDQIVNVSITPLGRPVVPEV